MNYFPGDEELTTKTSNDSDSTTTVEFKINNRKFVRNIVLFFVALEILGMIFDCAFNVLDLFQLNPIRELFDITREDSVQSWIGTTQTLFVGLTIWLIVIFLKKQGASIWRVMGWSFLALFFTYMAFDDATFFHERMGTSYDIIYHTPDAESKNLANNLAENFPSYYWQILYIPPLSLTAIFMIVFVWREIGTYWATIVCVALGCFVFAVGLDFIEGLGQNHPWNIWGLLSNEDWDLTTFELFYLSSFDTMHHFAKSFEETLEMFANTLLWAVFLSYLTNKAGSNTSIEFTKNQRSFDSA